MPLTPGTILGQYEIRSPLGAGGMGEVYRAHDSRLDREVAIKVLPSEVAKDLEKLDRFQREARVLASLNHPNIASIYGFEDSDKPGLVMELVEGPTLADRLTAGPVPIDEALPIAKQICEALECPRGCPEHAVASRCAAIRRLPGSSHKRRGYAPAAPRHSGGDAGECPGGEPSVHGSQTRSRAAPGTAR